MSDKKYGSYTDEDLNDWQILPAVAPILTSSQFGAWLMRRDKRRDKKKLEEIKAEIGRIKTEDGGDFLERPAIDIIYESQKILDN